MQRRLFLPLLCAFLCLPSVVPADEAADILKATGITGGFVVHIGSGDGTVTAALKANDALQVHGLDRDGAKVDAARTTLRKNGGYGPVSFERLDGDHLPYITGMVNLVVAEKDSGIAEEEIMRVLAPRGVAYVKQDDGTWKKSVKPVPAEIDDWTHYLHDSDRPAGCSGSAVRAGRVIMIAWPA
jgi:ubiquinone/menaquinone biosynthesis C-methylase UbiE